MPAEPRMRHNGQPQACEPCRKSKIRCDHESPQCSRCALRGLDCVYHPAPMTKRRLTSASQLDVSPTPFQPVITSPIAPSIDRSFQLPIDSPRDPPPTANIALPREAVPGSATSSGLSSHAGQQNTLFRKRVGRHETTRFSAVFFENQDSFGPGILDAPGISHEAPPELDETPRPQMALAVSTLLQFPTARTCGMLLAGIHHVYDVWVSPTLIRQCLDQVWTEYGDSLGPRRSRESVREMATDLFANSHTPPGAAVGDAESSFDRSGWINWFSGPTLRWEMIGILFSWAGMAFRHRQEWDPVFDLPEQRGGTRNTAANRMRECAAACVRLCEAQPAITDLMVICLKNSSKLQSIIISDESDRIRVAYGTVGSAFITAGLHRQPPLDSVTPFAQHRAALASSMYYLDKCESLFNARPPMLSRHYCHCPLPLDLAEEDVYGGQARLAAAVARLDAQGWNPDGRIFTTSWLRALAMLSPIREGILELSLSVNLQFTKVEVENLIIQLRDIVASYPAHLQYRHASQWPCGRSAHDMYIVTRIQLDVLQCHFLLQRLLVSRQLSGGQDLVTVAQETMSIILLLWQHRDQLQDVNHAFDWIAVSSGVPCAGILCLELLRASHLTPQPSGYAPVQLSRSEVIQSLTMFGALLDWIRPTDNNAQLSHKFRKVLQRIIDAVFDSLGPLQPAKASGPPVQQPGPPVPFGSDALDAALTTHDDMDWLNAVDWTQGDWLDQGATVNPSPIFDPCVYQRQHQSVMSESTPANSDRLPVPNPTVPFWHRDLDPLHDHRTTETLPASTDVAIIGAGYAGISTAYHLTKGDASDNNLSITILEARGVCSGATGRNGGHLRPDMYGHALRSIERDERGLEVPEFEVATMHVIKALIEREKIDCDFTLTRSIDVWCNEEAAVQAKGVYDLLLSKNLEYMKDVFFALGPDAEGISGVKGAKACASFTAGTIWPYKFILHLTRLILETGRVNLQTNTAVTGVSPHPDGGFSVSTPRGEVRAKKVVYANNAYVAGLLPQYRPSIVPCKGLCTHIVPKAGVRAPLLNNSYIVREADETLSYLIPRADGSIVVGGGNARYRDLPGQWYGNVDDSVLIEEVKDYYTGYMQRSFHGWEESGAEVDKVWTGIMGYTWDSQPHVGAVPGAEGQYVVAGFNGHGMPVVFLSALGVAKMVGQGGEFEGTGLPQVFQTTRERLDAAKDGPSGGDIRSVNG
ncbi:FAD dependent oxidoreductase superfamily [Aspergillus ellipticus CBS 707.79]|uniref:FAD dependent oxidoreductase superfamily n=1 Tax=Aspergillus ellipticus CBS 707.79 TaxID=1448320 RepID=A0A319EMV8_9EURO|nr:FAD dependent oxidoreductase superfamily [Aspergillus ellipticus CBS 707.79]